FGGIVQPAQQVLDPGRMLHGPIGAERELGDDPKIEVLAEPVPHEATRTVERAKGGRPLRFVAQHGDEHLGDAQIFRHLHRRHRDEPEPRVLQLPLEQRRDLLLDELVHPVQSFALHHRISTEISLTYPSTLPSMKSMAFETTSLAWRESWETQATARVARCQTS